MGKEGKTVVIQNIQLSTNIKPVDTTTSYVKVRPSEQGTLFFYFFWGGGGQALARFQFETVLGKSSKGIGVHSAMFKSHSLRKGAAINAAKLGISDDNICKA